MRKTNYLYLVLFLFLSFTSCKTYTHVADIDTNNYRVGSWNDEDPEINNLLKPYKEELDVSMNEVLAYNDEEMFKGKPSSPLGNWFTDILAVKGAEISDKPVAFAAQNYGGIRLASLPAGEVTVRHIYELMPFENYLVVLELDGKTVQQFLDLMAESGGWPVSEGLTFKIKNDRAADVMIQGKPLEPHTMYSVVLPDFVANGGDNAFFLQEAERMESKYLLRDLVIDYLRELPEDNKRIKLNETQRIYH